MFKPPSAFKKAGGENRLNALLSLMSHNKRPNGDFCTISVQEKKTNTLGWCDNALNVRLRLDLYDAQRCFKYSTTVYNAVYYYYGVATCGRRKDVELRLVLIQEDGKVLDSVTIHSLERPAEEGYGVEDHKHYEYHAEELYRAEEICFSPESPMYFSLWFDMKLSGENSAHQVKVDSVGAYHAIKQEYRRHKGGWDRFTMIIVDHLLNNDTLIDKINVRY